MGLALVLEDVAQQTLECLPGDQLLACQVTAYGNKASVSDGQPAYGLFT